MFCKLMLLVLQSCCCILVTAAQFAESAATSSNFANTFSLKKLSKEVSIESSTKPLTKPLTKQFLTIYTEQFPPYNFTVDNRITGINIELVKLACERANIDCTFVMLPWNRAFRNAKTTKHSGLVSTARTEQREALFKWVGPFLSTQNCIFKLSERKDIVVTEQNPVNNYTIGAASDASYVGVFTQLGFIEGQNFIVYPGKFKNMKPFAAGRLDLFVGSALSIAEQLNIAGLALKDITPIMKIDHPTLQGNFLALHIDTDQEIVSVLQSEVDLLKETGQAQQIEAKFFDAVKTHTLPTNSSRLYEVCLNNSRQ